MKKDDFKVFAKNALKVAVPLGGCAFVGFVAGRAVGRSQGFIRGWMDALEAIGNFTEDMETVVEFEQSLEYIPLPRSW